MVDDMRSVVVLALIFFGFFSTCLFQVWASRRTSQRAWPEPRPGALARWRGLASQQPAALFSFLFRFPKLWGPVCLLVLGWKTNRLP